MSYLCECGKTFTTPSSLGGHQSACKVHLQSIGKYDSWLQMNTSRRDKLISIAAEKKSKSELLKKEQWISEQHICERCGKLMTEKFGSGRFCSRACANGHERTMESRVSFSNKLTGKDTSVEEYTKQLEVTEDSKTCSCNICGKYFSLRGLQTHLTSCKRKHNIPIYAKVCGVELDITEEELTSYKNSIKHCEICGRTVEEAVKYTGKTAIKSLCVDHNHLTNRFRGMLCQICNRQLGWYEKYQDKVTQYLSKK